MRPLSTLNATFHPLPRAHMTLETWNKIMAYTKLSPKEVCGLGYVEQVGMSLVISDVFILDQVVTDSTADVTFEVLGQHITEMIRNNLPAGQLRFQWHSHAWGDTYCSHTDEQNISALGDNVDWLLSLVVNKHGDRFMRLDKLGAFPAWAEIPFEIELPPAPKTAIESCRVELCNKVKGRRNKTIEPTGEVTSTTALAGNLVEEGWR